MASAVIEVFTNTTTLSMLATAVTTATYSAYRANASLRKSLDPSQQHQTSPISDRFRDQNSATLETSTALALPAIASVSIIFLFFFLSSIGFVLTAISSVAGFMALLFTMWPTGESAIKRLRAAGLSLPTNGTAELMILAPVVGMVVLAWLFTGHWLANNIVCIGLCVLFASLCKVPNLKAAVAVFVGLFFYDIFFVFFSERFFGHNVMVEVATSEPTNPAYAIANYLNLPMTPVKTLPLPGKLMIPDMDQAWIILGLGDIALPAILMVYLLEMDTRNRSQVARFGYFARAVVSYTVGLSASFVFNFWFRAAQAALLYIVPSLLITTAWTGYRHEELAHLWTGPRRGASVVLQEGHIVEETRNNRSSSSKDGETTLLMA